MNYSNIYRFIFFITTALLLTSFPLAAQTAVPNFMSYQAYVTDSNNEPLGKGGVENKKVRFRIYNHSKDQDIDNILWSEEQTVSILDGHFSVLLGQGAPVTGEERKNDAELSTVFKVPEIYIGIKVGSNVEFTPRQRIVPSAYAFRAKVAESLSTETGVDVISLDGSAADINGDLDVSGFAEIGGFTSTEDSTINKVLTLKGIGNFEKNLNITGNLDVNGTADINGTTNLDGVDIDGSVQLDGSLTVGVDDTGHDVKLFGATKDAYLLWDESDNSLKTAGAATINVTKDKLKIGGIAVTTTAAELNKLDDVTSSTAQLNYLTATGLAKADFTKLAAVTSTATELNKLDDVTSSTAELNYVDVTAAGTVSASKAVVVDASRNISNFNEMKTTKLSIGGVSWFRWERGRLRHNRDIVVESHFFGGGNGTFDGIVFSAGRVLSSDEKLKKNIKNIEDGVLDKVSKLRPVTYQWKDADKMGDDHVTGFIAQEVEEVFPELIIEIDTSASKEGTSHKGLLMSAFPAITVQAIMELRKEKDAQIEALKEDNSALEARLDRLEALLEKRVN